jgi:hypothetical protein
MIYSTFSASMLKLQLLPSKCLPKKWRGAKHSPALPPLLKVAAQAPCPGSYAPNIYIIVENGAKHHDTNPRWMCVCVCVWVWVWVCDNIKSAMDPLPI